MAKKKQEKGLPQRQQGRLLVNVILIGMWLLLLAAMVSYSPTDSPNDAVWSAHHQPANWAGSIGAFVAHKIFRMLGSGAWIGMAGLLAWLASEIICKPIKDMPLRAAGVIVALLGWVMLTSLWFTSAASWPQGPGGLLGLLLATQVEPRFGMIGSSLLGLAVIVVGAILAADDVLNYVGKALLLKLGGLRDLRPPMPAMAGWRGIGVVGNKPAKQRQTDLDDDEALEEVLEQNDWPSRASKAEPVDEADDEEEWEYVDEEEDEEVDEVDEPVADPAAAYQQDKKQFDPEELRKKIKQLPINFAPPSKKSTEPIREVDLSGYEFPPMNHLEEPEGNFTEAMEKIVREQAMALENALREYRIEGEVVGIDSGPVITLFEVRLAPGTKVNRISAVSSDIARALKSQNIRIVPNMAGRDTIGVEVPNTKKEKVRLKELMTADPEGARKMGLPMYLGKDASGNPLIEDLCKMPHMLIAGTTGSGKSVCMNSIIMSFLYTKRPDELKLVLVDPKMVEMSMFKDVPHLMCPVVTEMAKAASILEWAVSKMDERYEWLAEAGVRDIAGYNALGWDELKSRFNPVSEEEEAKIPKKLPYMVFVIDELADLMMTNKEVENHIVRIAQKARAVGMHLILATQRPQANVVTGLIKSNMPCRVAFKVASGMDSRIVLDQKGAELLLGYGDMLFLGPRSSKLTRSQGTLVDDFEIRKTVKFLKNVAAQSFEPQLVQIKSGFTGESIGERDELFEEAVRVVLESQRGSVSLLQRRLGVGYSRASRLIEQIAEAGLLGEYKGSQAREVTMSLEEWEAIMAQAEADAAAVEVHGRKIEDDEESESADEADDYEYEYEEGDGDEEEWEYEEEEEDET